MKFWLGILLCFCFLSVEAAEKEAIQDSFTTVLSIGSGAIEANPLGLFAVPLKLGILNYTNSLPEEEKGLIEIPLKAVWKGATINNLCAIPVALSGGSFTPICLILGGIVGYNDWVSSQEQRTFWLLCKEMKKENQRLECKWNDPNKDS